VSVPCDCSAITQCADTPGSTQEYRTNSLCQSQGQPCELSKSIQRQRS
jgi:hypothetical protein